MKTNKNFLALVTAALMAPGCGGDSFSKQDAATAQTAAVTAITTAIAMSGSPLTAEQSGLVTVDLSTQCSAGGTIKITGEWQGASNEGAQSYYNVTAKFTDCSQNGVIMSGDLEYEAGINTNETGATVKLVMDGKITYRGSVEGECEFDVNIDVSAGTGGGSSSASGTICGQNYSGL